MRQRLPRIRTAVWIVGCSLLPFILLEAGLHIAGYEGERERNYDIYGVPFTEDQGKLVVQVGRKDLLPGELSVRKPPHTFRVFFYGGSVTNGYVGFRDWIPKAKQGTMPCPYSCVFQQALGEALGSTRLEVVNFAMPGMGTYRILPIIEATLKYEPDYVVVEAGHNEYVEGLVHENWVQTRALRRWKTLVLFANWWYKSLPVRMGNWAGSSMGDFAGNSPQARESLQRSEQNFRKIVEVCREAGVPVVFIVDPSNLRALNGGGGADSGLLTSAQRKALEQTLPAAEEDVRAKRYAEALAALTALQASLPEGNVPEKESLWFLMGRAYDALGDFERAKAAFTSAKDLLPITVRSPSAINDFVRSLAAPPNVLVLDGEKILSDAMPDGIPDSRIFNDHCHPTEEGHRLIGLSLAALVAKAAGIAIHADPEAEIAAARERHRDDPIEYLYYERYKERQ